MKKVTKGDVVMVHFWGFSPFFTIRSIYDLENNQALLMGSMV